MNFSQRVGKKPLTKDLQLESVNDELRNRLWNLIHIFIISPATGNSSYHRSDNLYRLCIGLWHHHYKRTIDEIRGTDYGVEKYIREKFFTSEWYDIYELIEFLSETKLEVIDTMKFISTVNNVLEEEFSAYRFVDGIIAPISNDLEVKEVEEALKCYPNFTALRGVNIHLSKALDKLSDKVNPDYRNSIKESISAVETTCRVLTGEATLGKALKSLERKGVKIDEQLKSGFEKIYAYTNSQEGIRHAIVDNSSNPDFDDAKYMLVTCSAFINYLVGKCRTLNIPIK